MKATIKLKSFPNPGHEGIPGHQGGSLPRDASANNDKITVKPKKVGGYVAISKEEYLKRSEEFAKNIDKNQFYALQSYTMHAEINRGLRGVVPLDKVKPDAVIKDETTYWKYWNDKGMHPEYESTHIRLTPQQQVQYMDSAMQPLPEDTILYRGALGLENAKFKEGAIYEDKGFASTSTDLKLTERFGETFVQISAPKGLPVAYAGHVSQSMPNWDNPKIMDPPRYLADQEIIIGRGMYYKYDGSTTAKGKTILQFHAIVRNEADKIKGPFAPKYNPIKYKELDAADYKKDYSRFAWQSNDLILVKGK